MEKPKEYFDLKLDSLRKLGGWAALCAEKALPIYEKAHPDDPRPREAIRGIRLFADGGKRTAKLRVLALDAFRAAQASSDAAASVAAQAACLAASSAFTHPLADVEQTKHILGPAAYAARALEIIHNNDLKVGEEEVKWAIEQVELDICRILGNMPARSLGKSRIEYLLYILDVGLRMKLNSSDRNLVGPFPDIPAKSNN